MSNLKIFTPAIEQTAFEQIRTLMYQPAFKDCKIRIMPDVHAGAGCVIGFTADLGEKVIPNIVGVDIGCGMLTIELGTIDIDFDALDQCIRKYVPFGRDVHDSKFMSFLALQNMRCYKMLRDPKRLERAIGSLGGGNHFIEIDVDDDNNKYLIVHTGSRNLGKQVAEYYQKVAISLHPSRWKREQEEKQVIEQMKAEGRQSEIEVTIKEMRRQSEFKQPTIPAELCYLEGDSREEYLHDMKICQKYAQLNRQTIVDLIVSEMGWGIKDSFETIHNYIDHESNIVRKGAISAKKDERLLIPLNMRDGCIVGRGKGNDEWNQSAPHGAGRTMSRQQARATLDLSEFKSTMEGIYTTCVGRDTIDESPMAYKSAKHIIECIKDTVDIEKIIRPIYNFKASE